MLDAVKTLYALHRKPKRYKLYDWAGPVFLFANENISGYLSRLNSLQDKTVLSVAASGDHAFESLLAGAKSVDLFDINYLQKHVVELKSVMIKHLSYSDFMRFFFDEKRFLDRTIVEPIWHLFSPGLKVFMTHFYRSQNSAMFRYNHAQHNEYSIDQFEYIKYPSEYKNLGRIMPNKFNFTRADVSEIPTKFNGVYDRILLSNIFEYQYIDLSDYDKRLMQFYHQVLTPIADKNLNVDGGQICFDYVWRGNVSQWADALGAIQDRLHNPIDDFDAAVRNINVVPVKSVLASSSLSHNPDLAMVLTQRQR